MKVVNMRWTRQFHLDVSHNPWNGLSRWGRYCAHLDKTSHISPVPNHHFNILPNSDRFIGGAVTSLAPPNRQGVQWLACRC